MAEQRNTDGRFTPEHTDEEILAAVRAHEPAATSEVADEVDMTRQGADRRLRSLRDEGRVNGKKIAASRVWFTGGAPEPTDRIDGVEWEEKRRQTLTRDDYTCQECGADVSKTGIEIHHKTPLAGGGDNSLSNLETLCPDCHDGKHSGTPPAAVLDVLAAVRGPVVTSADVADALDVTRETARRKLESLTDDSRLDSRKTAGRMVYWRAEDDAESGQERAATRAEGQADQMDPSLDATAETESAPDEESVDIDSLSFDRDLTPPRREQLEAWLAHVRTSDGGVTKSDFESWWSDERAEQTGYNAGSFWEAFAKASMKQSDRFQKPNARTYRWIGGGEAEP